MSKEAEYRAFAATCLGIATRTSDTADRTRLLAIAEAWLDLAERASQSAKRPAAATADHPLVLETLRRFSGAEGK